jgi:HEAT repeat protein
MVLRDIAAVPVLLELLNDDNEVVRSSAHNALERLDTDALVNALVRRLKNEDTENRCYAIRSLRDLRQDARPAAELLANAALNDADAEVRYWAIEAVTCIVGTEAKQTLLAALKDSNSSVRIEAAICLAMIEEALEQALPVLIEALQDKRREDRGDIAFRLAHFGSKAKASIPALCDALRDADETTRYMAAEALKQIDPEAARRAGIK